MSAGWLPDGAFSGNASGGAGAAFLKLPAGSRTAAMGGAGAAAARGPEALFHNPALLARFEPEARQEAALDYGRLLETSYAGSAAYARPLGRDGALAAGLVYAGQGAQTAYDAQGNAGGTFRSNDLALGAAYAHRLGRLRLGGGLKVIRQSLDDRSATGAALDLGVSAPHVSEIGEGPFDLGASVSHLGPPLKLGATADPLPLRVRLGGNWRATPVFDAAADIVLPADGSAFLALGFEARLPAARLGSAKDWSAALRLGFDQDHMREVDGLTGLTAGFGLDLSGMRVDYAWVPYGDLGTTNRVTLAFRF
ncbi:MAG: PorV/PorQ family protein [Elusimicrobiota bacterium]|nr:PorV/PorQ family protein [Elusimicrobiota bacterium]